MWDWLIWFWWHYSIQLKIIYSSFGYNLIRADATRTRQSRSTVEKLKIDLRPRKLVIKLGGCRIDYKAVHSWRTYFRIFAEVILAVGRISAFFLGTSTEVVIHFQSYYHKFKGQQGFILYWSSHNIYTLLWQHSPDPSCLNNASSPTATTFKICSAILVWIWLQKRVSSLENTSIWVNLTLQDIPLHCRICQPFDLFVLYTGSPVPPRQECTLDIPFGGIVAIPLRQYIATSRNVSLLVGIISCGPCGRSPVPS